MESEGVPERVHVSDTTYFRSRKDPDLRFEPDDKTRHSGGQIEGYEGNSWLAVIPGRVEGYKKTIQQWIDELFPLSDDKEDDNDEDIKKPNSNPKHRRSDSYGDSYERKMNLENGIDEEMEMKECMNNNGGNSSGGRSGPEIEMVSMKNEGMNSTSFEKKKKNDNISSGSSSKSSYNDSGSLKKIKRTPSMQAILDGEEPKFEGIPTFEGKNSSSSRKKNKERLNRYV